MPKQVLKPLIFFFNPQLWNTNTGKKSKHYKASSDKPTPYVWDMINVHESTIITVYCSLPLCLYVQHVHPTIKHIYLIMIYTMIACRCTLPCACCIPVRTLLHMWPECQHIFTHHCRRHLFPHFVCVWIYPLGHWWNKHPTVYILLGANDLME